MQSSQRRRRHTAALIAQAGILFAITTIHAQSAEKPWDRSLAAGIAVAAGNSDSVLFTGSLTGEKIWEHDELRLGLNGAYGKSNGDKSTEKLEGVGQYKHLFSERFYGTVVAGGLHDGVAELAYRLTVSPGLGYFFIKSEKTRLNGEIGPGYVIEKYNSQSSKDYFTLRVAERFERKLSDSAKCWQQTEWLPQVDDFSNYLLISEAGIEAALNKAMSLQVIGQHRYDNEPPPGNRHYDILLTSQIKYKF